MLGSLVTNASFAILYSSCMNIMTTWDVPTTLTASSMATQARDTDVASSATVTTGTSQRNQPDEISSAFQHHFRCNTLALSYYQ